jgi:predicted DNA-binding transcriptional regulator AlpA
MGARPEIIGGRRMRHNIDKRAARILDEPDGDGDDLLTTSAVAEWLEVSPQWLEVGRAKGYGPKFTKLSTRLTRYRRADILEWLKSRTHQRTSEYA